MAKTNKYALVTGGSRGIGREICLKLGGCGYHVLVNYKSNAAEAEKTLSGIRAAGGDGEALQFDVASGEESTAAIEAWQKAHEGACIEVVVNNAGIRDDVLMMWMEPQQWHSVIGTSLDGFYNVTRPLLKGMLVNRFGRIVNIVSLSGIKGLPGQANYAAAKGGVIAATKALAQEVANAAQNKIVVTGLEDEVDIKAFTMSNSEKIYTSLIEFVNKEVSNLVLGSESMAGGVQSYVGSTKAHQDIFRDRIEVYRRYIENVMNEQVVPRLVAMGYISADLEFKYSNRNDMNNDDRIKLYEFITDRYELSSDEIEKEFGIAVGRQLNVLPVGVVGGEGILPGSSSSDRGIMSDEEYYKRYGRRRGEKVSEPERTNE